VFSFLINNFLKLSNAKFTLLLTFLVILKNGVHPIGTDWIDWVYLASANFPKATNHLSNSLIPMYISSLLEYPAYSIWWMVFTLLTLLFYIFLFIKIKDIYGLNYKLALLIFLTFPFTYTPLFYIGHYDLFTIFGAILAGLTKKKIFVILGVCFAAGANPEQALATSLCVVLLSIGTKSKWHRFVGLVWLSCSILSFAMLRLFVGQPDTGDRLKIIEGQLNSVLLNSLGLAHILIFSVFSAGWVVLYLIGFREISKTRNLIVISAVAVIPVTLAITILDHTRVGVAVGALPLIIFLKHYLTPEFLNQLNSRYFKPETLLFVVLFTPSIVVDVGGNLRLPYLELIKWIML
jgi:hypothetical protein